MFISRTKLYLLLLYLGGAVLLYWRALPAVGRTFTMVCWLIAGAIVIPLVARVPVLRCPRCDRDTGYFNNWGTWGRTRYVVCRRCGCVMDRARGGREV